MRENSLKRKWAAGATTLNGWLTLPGGAIAECLAQVDLDALTIDLQHGLIDFSSALPMLQAISTTDIPPLARAPSNDPAIVGKLLDAGAYGIICPNIDTSEDCATFVRACRYAPSGTRSFGPIRATWYAGADYAARANDTVLAIAMIESEAALRNLDSILETPGLDAIYVGPSDLSLSMGFEPRPGQLDPTVLAAVEAAGARARARGIVAGAHCASIDLAQKLAAGDFRFVGLMTDGTLLQRAARDAAAAVREKVEAAQ